MAESAARTGDLPTLVSARVGVLGTCIWGPVPASEGLARADRLLTDPLLQESQLRIGIQGLRACALAMLDRPDEARQALDVATALATELRIPALNRTLGFGYTHWLLRDLDGAAELFQVGIDMLGPEGETGWVSTLLPMLGEVRLAQGDVAEARRCAERARDICPPADIESNARWRGLLALVESRAGRHEEAVRLAQEALEWELRGDQLDAIGDRYKDLAVVLAAAGRSAEAREALDRAVENFRRKENLASARRAADLRSTL
jgi:tetratricopeptide (TPR) repeat protein